MPRRCLRFSLSLSLSLSHSHSPPLKLLSMKKILLPWSCLHLPPLARLCWICMREKHENINTIVFESGILGAVSHSLTGVLIHTLSLTHRECIAVSQCQEEIASNHHVLEMAVQHSNRKRGKTTTCFQSDSHFLTTASSNIQIKPYRVGSANF